MKKLLIAAAVVMVTGAPLAFAQVGPNPPANQTTVHCSYVAQHYAYDRPKYKSEAEYRASLQQAYSLCRQDRRQHEDRTGGNVFR
jgi:hypothetical protein